MQIRHRGAFLWSKLLKLSALDGALCLCSCFMHPSRCCFWSRWLAAALESSDPALFQQHVTHRPRVFHPRHLETSGAHARDCRIIRAEGTSSLDVLPDQFKSLWATRI